GRRRRRPKAIILVHATWHVFAPNSPLCLPLCQRGRFSGGSRTLRKIFSCERIENSLKRLSLENGFEETFLFQLADNSQIKDLRYSRIFRQRLARADFVDKLLKAFRLGLEILGIKFIGDEVVRFVKDVGLV